MESWKDVNDFEGLYQVSNLGNIKSLKRKGVTQDKILKQPLNKDGYHTVLLWKDRNQFNKVVHRLISIAFIDNVENKPCINHIDGDKTNNSISNLEWCTIGENTRHYHKNAKVVK